MNAIDIIKFIIPTLSSNELIEVTKFIQDQSIPEAFTNRIKTLWQTQGKIAAIKEYKYYFGHTIEPNLTEAIKYVEQLCINLVPKR